MENVHILTEAIGQAIHRGDVLSEVYTENIGTTDDHTVIVYVDGKEYKITVREN